MMLKYGKELMMKNVDRQLDDIYMFINECRINSEKYYVSNESSFGKKCRICGSEKRTYFTSIYEKYNYYRCDNCESLYLDNLPNVEKCILKRIHHVVVQST